MKTIAKYVDHVAVILPFETELYTRAGVRAEFVGHPLLDSVKVTSSRADIDYRHPELVGRRLVSLLPGSREREIDFILPVMLAADQGRSAAAIALRGSATVRRLCLALIS